MSNMDIMKNANNNTGTDTTSKRVNNTNYNSNLFDEYRKASITSRAIKNKIRNGELPALPKSKVDGQPVCLGWHVKGMCNENCRRSADHTKYSDSEYNELKAWCTANYPTE